MNKPGHPSNPCAFRALLLSIFVLIMAGCAAPYSPEVMKALDLAGENSGQLEQVLEHFEMEGDPLKREAAEFLVTNMDGHGYTIYALFDGEEKEIPFNALDFQSFGEAQAALDRLEEEHGKLEFKRKRFIEDLQEIRAGFLIENIDLAFKAWREKPWARALSFEAFLEHILPYRGSNEPLHPWRAACLKRYEDVATKMKDPGDPKEAGRMIQGDVHRWVRFSDLYYLHPTDQGFEEMNERKLGRCEDISNMMGYAMRANAVPVACDYTPFWADRDNNHAWEVILDDRGRGKAGLSNRAAKVYRKTYSIQKDNLGCRISPDEKVPRWLSGKTYMDVTDQYLETTDVTLALEKERPEGARFAYLCVFNSGEWNAIQWGEIKEGTVTFTAMGRNIAYLPAFYVDEKLVPAAPPVILTRDGEVRMLRPGRGNPIAVEITATTPATPDADTRKDRPMLLVKPDKTYELLVWKEGWTSLGKKTADEERVLFETVPAGALFWLVEEKSRRLERIFTLEEGKQVWW